MTPCSRSSTSPRLGRSARAPEVQVPVGRRAARPRQDRTRTAVAVEEARLPTVKTPGVMAEDLHSEAGRKVLRFHLARMLAREPGTRDGADPEELHGMRVATRRMRAAWRVFGDAYQPDRTTAFRSPVARAGGPSRRPCATWTC